jgi:anti-sigma regulatory factor (Ser/Thr protein kinase)
MPRVGERVFMRELSLHVLDALENSLEAGATCIELVIEEDMAADRLSITIRDNGRGMDKTQLDRIFDPFFTTRSTRHVGLGVPLFKAAAERCNGSLTVTSQPGEGTVLQAVFQHSHIDRAPLGDLTGTLLAVILAGSCDVHYVHRVDGEAFEFHTADMRAELGEIPLTHPAVRKWLQEFIVEGEQKLRREFQ